MLYDKTRTLLSRLALCDEEHVRELVLDKSAFMKLAGLYAAGSHIVGLYKKKTTRVGVTRQANNYYDTVLLT